jgi:hypothetical protein
MCPTPNAKNNKIINETIAKEENKFEFKMLDFFLLKA